MSDTHLARLLGHRVHLLGILRAEHCAEHRRENALNRTRQEKKVVQKRCAK